MNKKILLIEDDGYMSEAIKNELENKGYNVQSAYSYESALDCWDDYDGNFDCLIIDLHINPRGMEPKKVIQYNPYYGIAAFDYFLEHPSSESSKTLENKTILYSGYIDSFRRQFESKQVYKGTVKIDKNKQSSFDTLIDNIDRICHG